MAEVERDAEPYVKAVPSPDLMGFSTPGAILVREWTQPMQPIEATRDDWALLASECVVDPRLYAHDPVYHAIVRRIAASEQSRGHRVSGNPGLVPEPIATIVQSMTPEEG